MPDNNSTPTALKHDLVVTRIFNAPIDLVWQAWIKPEQIMRWWGPEHFTSPSAQIDFREGGTSIVCMRAPKEFGGQDLYNTWHYTKIVQLERIEYIQNLSDKDGNLIDPVSAGVSADFPKDVHTVVTFKALGNKTELTVVEYGLPDGQMSEFAEIGLNQTLDKMAATFDPDRKAE